tara:strand:- start:39268 stop:39930 length:663 start_codon:yes stop_codon:yes gene_type:complete
VSSNLQFKQPLNNVLVTGTAVLAVSLEEAKTYLKIPVSFTQDDALITSIINSSTTFFERITGRDLISKTYKTYLDNFPAIDLTYKLVGLTPISLSYVDNGIIISKSKLQSITSIQYYSSGVLTVWDVINYYFTDDVDYSGIYLVKDKKFPEVDERKQSVVIEFVSGYGADATTIPNDIKEALLQVIAYLYNNRGDCECSEGLPVMAKNLFYSYIIIDHVL